MESVLLGMAAPAAVGTAGNLLERTLQTAGKPFAVLLHALSEATTANEADASPVTIESLRDDFKSHRKALATKIEKALSRAGVDLSKPIAIRISPTDGHLEIVGEHPQKALVEAALADDSKLASQFAELASLEQLLDGADPLNDSNADEFASLAVEQEAASALLAVNDDGASLEFH